MAVVAGKGHLPVALHQSTKRPQSLTSQSVFVGVFQISPDSEQPYNDIWTGNTYVGDWAFQAYRRSGTRTKQDGAIVPIGTSGSPKA